MTTNPYLEHVIGCNHRSITEVRLSDCEYGCKVYQCKECQHEMVIHSQSYGCRTAEVVHL